MLKTHLWDERKTDTLIQVLFGLIMLSIVGVCLCLSWILYAKKQDTLPNALLFPLGLFAAYAIAQGGRRLIQCIQPDRRKVLWILCSAGALLIQMVMVSSYYFYTDWDVETIVECAMASVTGSDISRHENYFSMYPNNLVLVTLFGGIVRIAYLLGLAEHAYFVLLVFQCVICWATGMLMCMLVNRMLHSDAATATAWVFYQLLVGLSPWISIPYSDAVALFFPTAILAAYCLMPKSGAKGVLRWFLLAFLSYFGYRIKPQILIVFIALCLYKATDMLLGIKWKGLLRKLRIVQACSLAAGLICAVLLANMMADDVKVPLNEELEFGIPHFLMMGMNTEEFGTYLQRDVSFSWRCTTRQERTQKNMEVFWQRVEEMGLVGLFKQLMRKTLTNFNDGTFCWAGEGIFYREILEENIPVLSPLLRSLYYSNGGKAYPLWQNSAQAIWMGVLLLAACACLGRRDESFSLIMLSLIGLTVFETLFEARARYLFCYAPLFIILAVSGMCAIGEWRDRILHRAVEVKR